MVTIRTRGQSDQFPIIRHSVNDADSNMSQIAQFYAGQTVFITGGTGFMGKILIEKLLRSCPDVRTVYLLVRAKKGKTPAERIRSLLADSVFDVLRNEYPDFAEKIVGVVGDVSEEGLGLSSADHALVIREVSVIFHLAATVRFNETLEKAVSINVNGTKSVVDVARECGNLKVGVYVSTAYSNCVRKTINEEPYPPPFSYARANQIVEDVAKRKLCDVEMENFTKKLIGEWPNTYSFTKAIAEGVVAEFASDLPFSIFRPSIVTSAYREPVPGWTEGLTGVTGIFCAVGLGISHVGLMSGDATCDVVPVDYVCNALISCAWETAITDDRHGGDIPVYNYVSGNENPITWKQLTGLAATFGYIYPPIEAIYYLTAVTTPSIHVFTILEFFLQFLPALVFDGVAKLFGKRTGLYKVMGKIGTAARAMRYFTTQEWDFQNHRVQNLWNRIEPQDRLTFPFSMRNVDWDEHVMKMVRGLWKYIVGQPDGSEAKARRRHFYLHIVHTIVRLTFGVLVLWIIWQTFIGSRTNGDQI